MMLALRLAKIARSKCTLLGFRWRKTCTSSKVIIKDINRQPFPTEVTYESSFLPQSKDMHVSLTGDS